MHGTDEHVTTRWSVLADLYTDQLMLVLKPENSCALLTMTDLEFVRELPACSRCGTDRTEENAKLYFVDVERCVQFAYLFLSRFLYLWGEVRCLLQDLSYVALGSVSSLEEPYVVVIKLDVDVIAARVVQPLEQLVAEFAVPKSQYACTIVNDTIWSIVQRDCEVPIRCDTRHTPVSIYCTLETRTAYASRSFGSVEL